MFTLALSRKFLSIHKHQKNSEKFSNKEICLFLKQSFLNQPGPRTLLYITKTLRNMEIALVKFDFPVSEGKSFLLPW